jgi:GT2 family glycosyltransferase
MRLSVIIPNYNGEKLLAVLLPQVLRALASAPYAWEIIVSDDVSTDGSCALVEREFPQVKLACGEANVGFGGNCNRGAEQARGECLAFVNSDVEIDTDVFTPLLECLSPSLFAVMPLVFAEGLGRVENVQELWISRGLPWLRPVPGIPLENPASTAAHLEAPSQVQLCGAFFVCHARLFRELGGFSPEFGRAYWEDVDLGVRARKLGYETMVCPAATVLHRHSITMDEVLGDRGKRRNMLRNQAVFLRRNLDALRPVPLFRLYLLLRIPQRLLSGDFAAAGEYCRVLVRFRA